MIRLRSAKVALIRSGVQSVIFEGLRPLISQQASGSGWP
ncbi:Uncharacterized protein dnm_038730 [Desulfonema magnum]|uniref:Uncharacterized protein n=1 Tax=Desulfonema magnum TaxID=45655 RepID=A0A975GND2_9BACT|nr:Uncharacterized protein dnm_038730 [Desulfonema magnum]